MLNLLILFCIVSFFLLVSFHCFIFLYSTTVQLLLCLSVLNKYKYKCKRSLNEANELFLWVRKPVYCTCIQIHIIKSFFFWSSFSIFCQNFEHYQVFVCTEAFLACHSFLRESNRGKDLLLFKISTTKILKSIKKEMVYSWFKCSKVMMSVFVVTIFIMVALF